MPPTCTVAVNVFRPGAPTWNQKVAVSAEERHSYARGPGWGGVGGAVGCTRTPLWDTVLAHAPERAENTFAFLKHFFFFLQIRLSPTLGSLRP